MIFRCRNDHFLSFEYVSNGGKEILGYDPYQVMKEMAFRKLVPKEDSSRNRCLIENLTQQNNSYQTVYRIKTQNGDLRWVHEHGTGVFCNRGKLQALEGLVTNIGTPNTASNYVAPEVGKKTLRAGLTNLIGRSVAMQETYNRLIKAAETGASVILTGESGTGKGVAAKIIHDISRRRGKPFVPVNCGAIAESLVESEFFGHEKGAFSGAINKKTGYLKAANTGTLFLDEIGEMPLNIQVKLLRALDGEGFVPVGGVKTDISDFRLVSATNRNLAEMVQCKKMREDFYYRVNMLPIHMPPLRERKEDIPLLIDHFFTQYSHHNAMAIVPTAEMYDRTMAYHWPGNVRELQNVVLRYLTFGELHFDSPEPIAHKKIFTPANYCSRAADTETVLDLRDDLWEAERDKYLQALRLNEWHRGNTAASMGISRRTLQRKVNKYNIKPN
jgi:PAS domain S-box-containing protein